MKRIALLVLFFVSYSISFASEPEETISPQEEKPGIITGIEVLSGYGISKVHEYSNYDLAPLIIDLNLDLKPAARKININYPGSLEFQVETFVNTVVHPRANAEAGGALNLKLGLVPDSWKFQPFALAGAGVVYMSQKTREQSTHFNFIEQVGLGGHYFISKKFGLTFECRYRHLSNAGIKHPNKGINTLFYLAGVSYQF